MPKYSFVIPVYQVEQYLEECVSSILCQTCSNYEIILIDDGSLDRSGEICDNYAALHSNIRVVHQENAGLSATRNVGIRIAAGEYIIFLDSDDYWDDAEGLRKIDCLIQPDVDIVAFASSNYYCDSGKKIADRYDYPDVLNSMKPQDCLLYLIDHDLLNLSAAKKVIRRNFLLEKNLFFQTGIRSEDVEWGIRLSNCLPTYRFLNEKLYVYRHRSNSISRTVGEKHLDDYLTIVREYVHFDYCNPEVQEYLLSYVTYQYSLLLAYITLLKPAKRKDMLAELKEYRHLFQYVRYPRSKMISTAHRFIGFHGTRFFLALYLKRSIRT